MESSPGNFVSVWHSKAQYEYIWARWGLARNGMSSVPSQEQQAVSEEVSQITESVGNLRL